MWGSARATGRRSAAKRCIRVGGGFAKVIKKVSKTWLAIAGVVVLAGTIGVGWWMGGKDKQGAGGGASSFLATQACCGPGRSGW